MLNKKTKSIAMLMLMMCGVSSVSMGSKILGSGNDKRLGRGEEKHDFELCLSESIQAARQEINNAFNATRFVSLASIGILEGKTNVFFDIFFSFQDSLETQATLEDIMLDYKNINQKIIQAMKDVEQKIKESDKTELLLLIRSQCEYIIFLYKAMILRHISLDNVESPQSKNALKEDIQKIKDCLYDSIKGVTTESLLFGQIDVDAQKEYKLLSNYIDNVVRDTFVTLAEAMKPNDKTSCIELLKQYYGDKNQSIGIRELYWGKLNQRKAQSQCVAGERKELLLEATKNYYNTNVAKIKEEIEKLEQELYKLVSAADESASTTSGQNAGASAGKKFSKEDFLRVKNQITEKCSLILLVANLTQILLSPNPPSIEELHLDMIIQSLVFDAGKAEKDAIIEDLKRKYSQLFESAFRNSKSIEEIKVDVDKIMEDASETDRAIAFECIQKLIKEDKDNAIITATGAKRPGATQTGSATKKQSILTREAYEFFSLYGIIQCKNIPYTEYCKDPSKVDTSSCKDSSAFLEENLQKLIKEKVTAGVKLLEHEFDALRKNGVIDSKGSYEEYVKNHAKSSTR
jgi:hypothetical protein